MTVPRSASAINAASTASASRHRVLLVDDEPLARQRLRQLLAGAPDFDVVGECSDGRAVADAVRAHRPDVVFLDVRMPFMDGFEAQQAIAGAVRHVVFVTAHPEHAARAFDTAASDYLVKPVTVARFEAALARLRRALGAPGEERVVLGGRQGGAVVLVSDVSWVEADGAYVVVHAAGARHTVRESVSAIVERLGAHRFLRVHRSVAINLAHVRALRPSRQDGRQQGLDVELADGTRLPISRRKASEVVALLRQEPPAERAADRNTDRPPTA